MVQPRGGDFAAPEKGQHKVGPSQSVLVVDDEPDVRMMLRQLLELEGYSVREATNGAEALEVLAGGKIAVLITDLFMPRMNGFELLRAVQSSPTVPRIVAMSGVLGHDARPTASEAAVLLSTNAILDKPFTRRELIRAITPPEPDQASSAL